MSTATDRPRTHIIEGTVAGCDLALLCTHHGAPHYLLQLDRSPHTWTRTLTAAELAALARLNPDDGVPYAARQVIADLTIMATGLSSDWHGYLLCERGEFVPNAILHPLGATGLNEIGRVASALVAALGGVAR